MIHMDEIENANCSDQYEWLYDNGWDILISVPCLDIRTGEATTDCSDPFDFGDAVCLMVEDDRVRDIHFRNSGHGWEYYDDFVFDALTGIDWGGGAWKSDAGEVATLLDCLQGPRDAHGVPLFPGTPLGNGLRATMTDKHITGSQTDWLRRLIDEPDCCEYEEGYVYCGHYAHGEGSEVYEYDEYYEHRHAESRDDWLARLVDVFNNGMQGLQWKVTVYEPADAGMPFVVRCDASAYAVAAHPYRFDNEFIPRGYEDYPSDVADWGMPPGYAIRAVACGWWENPDREHLHIPPRSSNGS